MIVSPVKLVDYLPSFNLALTWSPCGKYILVVGVDANIWNIDTGRCQETFQVPGAYKGCTWTDAGIFVATSHSISTRSEGAGEILKMLNLRTGQYTHSLTNHKGQIQKAFWSPNQLDIAFSSSDNGLYIWNLHDNTCTLLEGSDQCKREGPGEHHIALSPCGTWLAASNKTTLIIWHLSQQRLYQQFMLEKYCESPIIHIAWSPRSDTVFACNQNQTFIEITLKQLNTLYDIEDSC